MKHFRQKDEKVAFEISECLYEEIYTYLFDLYTSKIFYYKIWNKEKEEYLVECNSKKYLRNFGFSF